MGSKKISELTDIEDSGVDFNPNAAYMIIEQGGVTYKMRMNTGFVSSDTSSSYAESKTINIAKQTGVASYGNSSVSFSKDNICARGSVVQIEMSCVNTQRGYEGESWAQSEMTALNTPRTSQVLTKPSDSTYFDSEHDINSSFNILIGSYNGYAYRSGGKGPKTVTPVTSSVYAEISPSVNSLSFRPYITHKLQSVHDESWWLNNWVARFSGCMAASVTVSVSGTIRS